MTDEALGTISRGTVTAPRPRLQRLLTNKIFDVACVAERSDGDPWEPTSEGWKALRILARECRGDADLMRLTLTVTRHER